MEGIYLVLCANSVPAELSVAVEGLTEKGSPHLVRHCMLQYPSLVHRGTSLF
jgi:hypothetical protein